MFSRALPLLVVVLLAFGCAKKGEEKSSGGKSLASYTTKGMLKAMTATELTIHHETITEFKNRKGETQPMMSMSMPFGVADGLETKGIATGDIVEFTFDVDYERSPVSVVTAIKKLPADAKVELSGH